MFTDQEKAILSAEIYQDPDMNLTNGGYNLPTGIVLLDVSSGGDDGA